MLNLDSRAIVKVVVGPVFMIALVYNAKHCVQELQYCLGDKTIDQVDLLDDEFAQLRNMLSSYGEVGYVSDEEAAAKTFYLIQYAVSPVLVVRGLKPVAIIGNFEDSAARLQFIRNNHLMLLKKIDANMMLFIREAE